MPYFSKFIGLGGPTNNLNSFIYDNPWFGLVFVVLLLWTLYWKGMALWKSAHLNDKWWFIALLVINTLGILEILYIYIWSKRESLKTQMQ